MNNRNITIIGVVVVILLVIGGLIWFNRQSAVSPAAVTTSDNGMMASASPMDMTATQSSTMSASASASGAMAATTGQTKKFTVEGSNFKFVPNQLSVNAGDTVQITFKNTGGMMHDFVIDAFKVKTDSLEVGKQQVVSFVADKPGTYEFYCSIGNHRAQGMKGTLTVK